MSFKTGYEGDNAWIPLADAIKLITDKVFPDEDRRRARNRVRLKIRYAEKQGKIHSRKLEGHRVLLDHFSFDTWAVIAWPDMSDVINPPKLELRHLTPARELVSLPPTVDRSTVDLPDDYDALKELHFSALDELLRTKSDLQDCRYELAELVRRDDILRQKKIEAGKKSKGVCRPGRKR